MTTVSKSASIILMNIILFYVNEHFARMCLCVPRVCLVSSRGEKGFRSPETEVTEGCVLGTEFKSSEGALSAGHNEKLRG